jgi:hypothetical protein
MTDLAINTPLNMGPSNNLALKMDASQEFFAGAMIALDTGDGYAEHMDDEPGLCFMGICSQYQHSDASRNDDTNHTIGTGQNPARIPLLPLFDRLGSNITVAGVTGVTDHGKLVFATDDNVKTLTAPADDRGAVGIVWEFTSTGVCKVLFFTPMESALMTLLGTHGQMFAGIYNFAATDFGTTSPYFHTVVGVHGLITGFTTKVSTDHVGATSTMTINAIVGAGSNIFATADIINAVAVAVTGYEATTDEAVVAANAEFHDGDVITITVSDGAQPPTAGIGAIMVNYKRLIGV